jgi:prepilin-type N-terminal cleavage/methylation domain-containing protein
MNTTSIRRKLALRMMGAFTLIELLVVVSIIALLVSILMPSLGKAREQARRTVCASHLHSVATAFILYSGDNREWLPLAFTPAANPLPTDPLDYSHWHAGYNRPGGNIVTPDWLRKDMHDALAKYGLSDVMWVCPAAQNQKGDYASAWATVLYLDNQDRLYWNPGWTANTTADGYWPYGYEVGCAILTGMVNLNANCDPAPRVAQSPVKANEKGNKHLVADLNLLFGSFADGGTAEDYWAVNKMTVWSKAAHRASKGSAPAGGNRAYLDAHVEWIRPERMGFDDLPQNSPELVPEARGKYDYMPSFVRDCFW